MNRTRLNSLLLVNWRGLFFQPFVLDSRVTALEGENGAGKTTVMIGLFVALLPDQRLLQFRNLSEAGASEGDRGIYGRLGDKGFSYSVLDITGTKGQRILAGVRIKKLGEPKLDLSLFIIEGLAPETDLESLFLVREGERERIADLGEVRDHAGGHGGSWRLCEGVGQYTKLLFELNVLPLALDISSEREKFYRLLHTSMYGGLSGSIQKGLRDYLLTEDTKLRNHVSLMRDNLDACRATRRELGNARQRYDLIHAVYKAGFGMFEAAFHATRLRFENQRNSAQQTRLEHRQRREALATALAAADELEHRHRQWREALQQRRLEHEQAQQIHENCQAARRLLETIEQVRPKLDDAELRRRAALAARDQADAAQRDAEAGKEYIEQERAEIVSGLADAQKAWEQVHHKVSLYRQARKSLADARAALPDREITQATAESLQTECEKEWQDALEDKAHAKQALESLDARLQQYRKLLDLLARLHGQAVPPHEAAPIAAQVDRTYHDLADRIERAQDLPTRIQQAHERAERQTTVRRQIEALNGQGFSIQCARDFRSAVGNTETQKDTLQQQLEESKEQRGQQRELRSQLAQSIQALEKDWRAWRQADELRQTLRERVESPLDSAEGLAVCKQNTEQTLRAAQKQQDELERQVETCGKRIQELEYGGGHLDERLLHLRDLVDGELLLERYEDVPENQAALVEARLGPLHSALVVENVADAARRLAARAECPDTLWLLQGHTGGIPDGDTLADAELVKMGSAWRLSRHPAKPVVGRAAREKALAQLRAQENALKTQIQQIETSQQAYQEILRLCDQLSPHRERLGAPSPETELNRQQKQLRGADNQLRELDTQIQVGQNRLGTVQNHARLLAACIADAELLDAEDWRETRRVLQEEQKIIALEQTRWQNAQADLHILRANRSFLEQTPPSEQERDELARRLARAKQTFTYWLTGRELLATLRERLPGFQYHDQEKLLEGQQSVLASLQERQKSIETRLAEATDLAEKTRLRVREAGSVFNSADSGFTLLEGRLQELRQQLNATGEDGSAQRLAETADLLAEAGRQFKEAEQAERDTERELIRTQEEQRQRQDKLKEIRAQRLAEIGELRCHWRTWQELKRETARENVLDKLLKREKLDDYAGKNPINLFEESSARQSELRLRLEQDEHGEGARRNLDAILSAPDAETGKRKGYATLQAWVAVRHFLEQRIPRDIAQADDPEQVLAQIAGHLRSLQTRLQKQEEGLHQKAGTVASAISSRLRREENRIRGLNHGLAAVSFGSIRSVRIKLERIEAMQRLLDSLPMQKGLFNAELPLEQAMTELYKQVGGGQVRGDLLLDYREYVRMQVEVQRMDSERWYKAHSNALSTGEAIGVGAAVLMVILEAWEQQSILLRGARSGSSLRFLFLDEANRLSPESLDTLADLCVRMRMQLLVAAPGIDKARQGIIYRLIRQAGEHGEEVLVRGRRLADEAAGP